MAPPRRIVFVCGVCGAGKTTVGKALAAAELLGGVFLDADDWHPPSNRSKLARGEPLTDADREPFLEAVAAAAATASETAAVVVVACSALKRAYRGALRTRAERGGSTTGGAAATASVDFVLLDPPEHVLVRRLGPATAAARRAARHPLPDALPLLPTQLATLERGTSSGDEWAAVYPEEERAEEEEEEEETAAAAADVARFLARRLRARWEGRRSSRDEEQ
jgi:gluconokinase